MAARKSNSRGRKKKSKAVEEKKNFIKKEVTIWTSLAICIFLTISNFGLGGIVGEFLSGILFGLFGMLAYIVPVMIFIGIAFLVGNQGNSIAYVKFGAGVVLSFMICTLFQLIMNEYIPDAKIFSYYEISRMYKDGGGLIGGLFVSLLCPSIGLIGTYLIVVIVSIICLVLITEKSFLKGIQKGGEKAYTTAKSEAKRHKEYVGQKQTQKTETRRKDKVVSGVSFDTTISKKAPDVHEIKPEEDMTDELFGTTHSGQMVINRSTPLIEDEPVDDMTHSKQRTKESQKQVEKATEHIEQEIKIKETKPKSEYKYPPMSLLQKGKANRGDSDAHLRQTALKLQQTLQNFNVNVTVTNVSCGPSVTRYELQPEQGVKVSKIVGLADDIKLNLAASDIRIEAPIPGKAAVGIEVPNKENATVMLRDLLETDDFKYHGSKIAFAAGRDIAGKTIIADIAKMPHVLIAGATGSGKSVCINTLIMSILYKATPDEVKLIMIDPKVVELSCYNGIPHLLIPVVTDPKKAAGALNWAVTEMTKRYQFFAECNVRDIQSYNAKVESISDIDDENKREKLPQIIVIVDELADLMMVAPGEVEDAICRLAQLARAAGIHLVLATQRPSVNVITGLIKANMPSRIAFAVSSGVDSRTIIDMNGAEKLLGKGDMLYYPAGIPKPIRVQGAFVSEKEVQSVVEYLTNHGNGATYDEEITNHINNASQNTTVNISNTAFDDEKDMYFADAARYVIEQDRASIGMLQRKFKLGFNRAARIMDQLHEEGIVGGEEGTKPRKVLMTHEQFEQYMEEYL